MTLMEVSLVAVFQSGTIHLALRSQPQLELSLLRGFKISQRWLRIMISHNLVLSFLSTSKTCKILAGERLGRLFDRTLEKVLI